MNDTFNNIQVILEDEFSKLNENLEQGLTLLVSNLQARGILVGEQVGLEMKELFEKDVKARGNAFLVLFEKVAPPSNIVADLINYISEVLKNTIAEHQNQLDVLCRRFKCDKMLYLNVSHENIVRLINAKIDLLMRAPSKDKAVKIEYVSESRLSELRSIVSKQYDLKRLVRLCEEVNICYSNNCYHAVAVLTRAILDHIPPIFKSKNFSEVANNYSGGKSFSEIAKKLDGITRKIADKHLHTPVRTKEVLPSEPQIDNKQGMDVLLAEIVRILS